MFSFMNFRVTQSDDPLTLALTPSVHETKDQRRVRERAQAVAKRANDEIERQIARDREEEGKKKKRPIKVVLVGERNDELFITYHCFKNLVSYRSEWKWENCYDERFVVSSWDKYPLVVSPVLLFFFFFFFSV
jgi:hypothetical protein